MKWRCLVLTLLAGVGLLTGCEQDKRAKEAAMMTGGGNANAGQQAIRKYGCYACHTISGVPGAQGLVGPPLDGIANRTYIAGEIQNTPANLMLWIQHPHQVEPHTVMPEMNVTDDDSRNIAAYLYTLR